MLNEIIFPLQGIQPQIQAVISTIHVLIFIKYSLRIGCWKYHHGDFQVLLFSFDFFFSVILKEH